MKPFIIVIVQVIVVIYVVVSLLLILGYELVKPEENWFVKYVESWGWPWWHVHHRYIVWKFKRVIKRTNSMLDRMNKEGDKTELDRQIRELVIKSRDSLQKFIDKWEE